MNTFKTTLFFFLFSFSIFSQTEDKKWSFGIYGGLTQYSGDRGQEFYSTSQAAYGFGGLALSRYFSKHFDVSFLYAYGEAGNVEQIQPWTPRGDQNAFRVRLSNISLNFRYLITKPQSIVRPFFTLGASVILYEKRYTNTAKRTEFGLPNLGAGISIRLNEFVSLQLHENFVYTTADDLDFEVNELNDSYLYHTIGVTFNLGKTRDSDDDGISDSYDKCPGTQRGLKVSRKGCPFDSDNDEIPDHLDECPNEKGSISLNGCPDKDGDGVADKFDKCPNISGTLTNGCPDSDGDGITDSEDHCSDTPKRYSVDSQGCPLDNDKDGVYNEDDYCLNLEGEPELNGCPDSDEDGIADINDRCPTYKGTKASKGCPAISYEDSKKLELISQKIYFDNRSDKLKQSSLAQLKLLVDILKKYPAANIDIDGYSDEQGSDSFNLMLSEKRVISVKEFLISKGIASSRIKATGYGRESMDDKKNPVANSRNRRVEFSLSF